MEPLVPINEYRNGALTIEWDSVTDAAKAHRVSYALIKTLCATGNPLPDQSDSITFDTPYDSPYHYEMSDGPSGQKKPLLVCDTTMK